MGNDFRKISIIGLGYIGLPTATMFAGNGLEVIGVDINKKIVDKVNKGEVHIIEPDLEEKVADAVRNKKLRASTSVEESDAFVIAVPTPFKENHKPDVSFVEAAARSIAPSLRRGNLVILESTSPVGTTLRVAELLAEMRPDLKLPIDGEAEHDIHVAYCPERVLPGKTMYELVHNDRVIGGVHECCSEKAKSLYGSFVEGECLVTDSKTAEMAKLTENSYRDVNIAFANELSIICDRLGIDVWELIRLANHHPRVKILNPGPGVGGHCIAVDPWFIVDSAPEESRLIRTAREVNDSKPGWVIAKVKEAIGKVASLVRNGASPKVACLGLSFKANIDDLRESPAVEIVDRLSAMRCCEILVVEPHIDELPPKLRNKGNVRLLDLDDALQESDVIVGLVDRNVFKAIPFGFYEGRLILDTKGIFYVQGQRLSPRPHEKTEIQRNL